MSTELTQQEIDALMRGMGAEEADAPEPEAEPGALRRYDLSSQERIVRGRMPTLDIVMERFARNLRVGLFSLIRRTAEVSVHAPQLKKFSAFLREIVVPTNFNIVSVRP